MLKDSESFKLNEKTYANCYLHRSSPNDVARTEHLTFIAAPEKDDVGPTNNWMDPEGAKHKVGMLLNGAMRGRTMYVVPYIMGPVDSPLSKIGVEVTDSHVRGGQHAHHVAHGQSGAGAAGGFGRFCGRAALAWAIWTPCGGTSCISLQEKLIWSVGSGYGGNALLGKKCFALRIASTMARDQGWMAEHMLILGLEDPTGKVTYMAAAFPSACGKTNLAMMVSALESQGYRVWTVGDDIAWMKIGADGYLHAINPEAGFFGVAPGTGQATNPNVMEAIRRNTIFTNTGLTADNEPWWEGIGGTPPAGLINWKGEVWDSVEGSRGASEFALYGAGEPVAEYFAAVGSGGGRADFGVYFWRTAGAIAPLVYESFDWQHGTFVGATMASETTAAATGEVGIMRRDPMAMLPFCGYNMADYFGHWLEMGKKIPHPPKIFHVNWFRRGADGKFLWPGYGENVRVLKWILERVEGRGSAQETPIGYVPGPGGLTLDGMEISAEALDELMHVNPDNWQTELDDTRQFFDKFGSRLPREMREEHEKLSRRLQRTVTA